MKRRTSSPSMIIGALAVSLTMPPTVSGVATAEPLAVTQASTAESMVQPISREPDGLFYLTAEINGTQVRFLVDTGASIVVLTPQDAQRVGVTNQARETATRIRTVSGSSAMRLARLERVRIGHAEIRGIDAAIVDEGLRVSLLGQNALTQLGSVTIAGNRLHLR